MKLIVGLGNPGKEYAGTRHNIGFEVLDKLAEEFKINFSPNKKFNSKIADFTFENMKIVLVKPLTFMNSSGEAVRALKTFYKVENKDLLIVHDEMDFKPGRAEFKVGAGAAGHNGVISIQERLGTKDFARLRVGIGRPEPGMKHDYVLSKFHEEDDEPMKESIKQAVHAIKAWIELDLTKAMDAGSGV